MKKEVKKKNENIEVSFKINKEKLIKGIGIACIVLAVLGIAFVVSSKTKSKSFAFVNITIDEYLEKMKESDKSIIYVARPGCSWCQKESPILKTVGAKYDLTVHYLNTDDVTSNEDAYEKFTNSSEHYKEDWGTPNTIIVQNGEIVDGIFGYAEKEELIKLFKRNGFINE